MLKYSSEGGSISIETNTTEPVKVSYKDGDDWVLIGDFDTEIVFDEPKLDNTPIYCVEFENRKEYFSKRIVNLEGTFNFRDLGGYTGAGNKRVVWNTLYRADALNNLTENDVDKLEKAKLKTIVDFRSERETKVAPNVEVRGSQYINLSPEAPLAELSTGNIVDDEDKILTLIHESAQPNGKKTFEKRALDMRKQMISLATNPYSLKQYHRMFEILLSGQTPLVQHCKGGKDRTGFGAMLILMSLGVSKEDIISDYMLTELCMYNRNLKRMNEYRIYTDNEVVLEYLYSLMATKRIYIEGAFEVIGEDFDAYLIHSVGLKTDEIKKMQELYLED